ncbi:transposase [Pedobacter suwonensis]
MLECGIDSFRTVARSIQSHYLYILNFFINRSTNASAESFNAKIKAFRATSGGVEILNSSYSDYRKYMLEMIPPKNSA